MPHFAMPVSAVLMFKRFFTLLTCAFVLSGCAVYNTTSDGKTDNLMLKGYDPVSYFKGPAPVAGKPEFTATHEYGTYYFASAAHRDEFRAAPDKFAPQYGGFCANGLVYAVKIGGEPTSYRIVDGKVYIFGESGSRNLWAMDIKKNQELGDKYWRDEAKDTSARWQSFKRLTFRVPHYKTGKELNEEYAAWLAKGNKPLP
jgi:YHS domain-containing protein